MQTFCQCKKITVSFPFHLFISDDTFVDEVICPHHRCLPGQSYASTKNSSEGGGQILCYCDDKCAFYKDCCPDYEQPQRSIDSASLSSCVHLTLYNETKITIYLGYNASVNGGYQLITKCPSTWTDEVARTGCEAFNPNDAISTTPVSSTDSLSYRNVYCAICNEVPIADIQFWRYDPYNCGDKTDDFYDQPYFSELVEGNQWYAALYSASTQCSKVQYTIPENVQLRHCIIGQISDCPSYFSDRSMIESCRSNVAALVPHHEQLYKNSYCAKCNGIELDDARTCNLLRLPGKSTGPPPLSVLFGFQPQETEMTSTTKDNKDTKRSTATGHTCRPNEMFDPFAEKCRPLFCKHGFILKHGRCVPHIRSQENCGFNHGTITARIRVPQTPDTGQCSQSIRQQCPPLQSLLRRGDFTLAVCTSTNVTPEVYIQAEFKARNISVAAIEKQLIFKLNEEDHPCKLEDLKVITRCYGNWSAHASCSNQSHSVNEIDLQLNWAEVPNSSIRYNLNETPYEMIYTFNDASQSVEQAYTFYLCNEQCPERKFEPGSFILNGSTVILSDLGITLLESDVRWQGDSIFVCQDMLTFTISIFEFDMVQVVLTLIGTIVSLIALLLCLVTYVVFPALRNLPGKSVMSLIVALFTAQLLFLFVGNATENQTFCTAVAVILHYVWLASFSWTSTIAFYLSRTLGTQARPRATEHRDCDKKFLQFSLYGWGAPLIILIACVIVEFCSHIPIVYGTEKSCWIGDHIALMTAFFLPIAIALIVNGILYARILIFFTFRGIASSGPSMDKLRRKRLKRDSMVSLKVCNIIVTECH